MIAFDGHINIRDKLLRFLNSSMLRCKHVSSIQKMVKLISIRDLLQYLRFPLLFSLNAMRHNFIEYASNDKLVKLWNNIYQLVLLPDSLEKLDEVIE